MTDSNDDEDDIFDALAQITKIDSLASFDSNVNSTLFDVDSLLEEDGFSGQKRKQAPTSYGAKASASRTSLCSSASTRNSALSWLNKNQTKKKQNDKKHKLEKSLSHTPTRKDGSGFGTESLNLESIYEDIQANNTTTTTTTATNNNNNNTESISLNKINSQINAPNNRQYKSVIGDILGEMDELTNTELPMKNNISETNSLNNSIDSNYRQDDIDNVIDQLDDDNIDVSLENLDFDETLEEDITTPDAIICQACEKPILSGPACKISKGTYHVEHFVCVECNESLLNKPFYERLDKLYCVNDYIKKFAHICEVCKEPVLNDIILSLGLYYHMEHFKCRVCEGVIGDKPYHLVNKIQHCEICFQRLFTKSCEACGEVIASNHVSVQGKFWHSQCFTCSMCSIKLENGSFQVHQNKLLCINDYHRTQGTICHSCNQPVVGKCVQSKGRFYHAEHFVCNHCKIPLISQT